MVSGATWLRGLREVRDVHDLHVWAMSTTQNALTAHLVVDRGAGPALPDIAAGLHDRFGVEHSTIQIENADEVCGGACDAGGCG